MPNLESKDRKHKIVLLAMVLMTVGYAATGFFPALGAMYSTYIMGLLSAAGVHGLFNVASKHVSTLKAKKKKEEGAP